jgi:hypothetical protein
VPTYVYGITFDADPRLPERGVAGAAVRTLDGEGLCALVATIADEPVEANRANLMAHTEVLQEVLRAGDVVPMRFGIVLADDAAVRSELLERRRDDVRALLDEVEGRVELSLSAYYVEDAVLAEIVTTTPAIARLRESIRSLPDAATYYERIRLGEMVAAELRRRRAADAALLRERLAPLAVATQEGEDLPERTVLRASFLVPREDVQKFRDEVDALAGESAERMTLKLVGPLPPFSFVDVNLEAGAVA